MSDEFASQSPGLDSPASRGVAVTPSDSTTLTTSRALYVGGAGDVAALTVGGDSVTFVAVPAGTVLPIRVTKVLATGTTATSILALW